MKQKETPCCIDIKDKPDKGVLSGILYGLIPHSFCIAFIVFSIIGTVAATAIMKKFLLIPYFFHLLVFASFAMAAISSIIYLRKNSCLCVSGIKTKWRYLATLFSSIVIINILLFFVIFPALANTGQRTAPVAQNKFADVKLSVQIPCSGHAPLITDEIKKNFDVYSVNFELPNIFDIKYDPQKTTPQQIASLDIFKTYEATIIN